MDNQIPVDVLIEHIRKNINASGTPTQEAIDDMGKTTVIAIASAIRTFSAMMCGVIAQHTGQKLEDLMISVGLDIQPEAVEAVRQFVGTETHH